MAIRKKKAKARRKAEMPIDGPKRAMASRIFEAQLAKCDLMRNFQIRSDEGKDSEDDFNKLVDYIFDCLSMSELAANIFDDRYDKPCTHQKDKPETVDVYDNN